MPLTLDMRLSEWPWCCFAAVAGVAEPISRLCKLLSASNHPGPLVVLLLFDLGPLVEVPGRRTPVIIGGVKKVDPAPDFNL